MHKEHGQRFHFRVARAVTSTLTRPHTIRLAVVAMLFLPLTVGPALWIGPTFGFSPEFLSKVFRSMLWLRHRAPDEVAMLFDFYLDGWSAENAHELIVYHYVWELEARSAPKSDFGERGCFE